MALRSAAQHADYDAHSTSAHLCGCTVGCRPPGEWPRMRYLSVLVDLLASPQKGRRTMPWMPWRHARSLLLLSLIALSACQPAPRAPGPAVSTTVSAAAQATR